jgi:hypothetical protein
MEDIGKRHQKRQESRRTEVRGTLIDKFAFLNEHRGKKPRNSAP